MTRILCAVGMRNAKLRNNLKENVASHKHLLETPVFKDIVFWRLNERFTPNRTGNIFSV